MLIHQLGMNGGRSSETQSHLIDANNMKNAMGSDPTKARDKARNKEGRKERRKDKKKRQDGNKINILLVIYLFGLIYLMTRLKC
jgi:hypothetical protein